MESRHSDALFILLSELYSAQQVTIIDALAMASPTDLEALIDFDRTLPGPSLATMNRVENGATLGRYEIADRDVFRPLQYCLMYFWRQDALDWFARDIVEMSCSHIEALVKRIGETSRFPLGRAMQEAKVRRTIDEVTYDKISRFVPIYNDAKHGFDHAKDTHMYSVQDAYRAYFVARALGEKLYPLAPLTTDMSIFEYPAESGDAPV